jgi:hypothetical protein
VSETLAEAIEAGLEAVKKVPDLSVPGLEVPAQPATREDKEPPAAEESVTVGGEKLNGQGLAGAPGANESADSAATAEGKPNGTSKKRPSTRKPPAKKPPAKKPAETEPQKVSVSS